MKQPKNVSSATSTILINNLPKQISFADCGYGMSVGVTGVFEKLKRFLKIAPQPLSKQEAFSLVTATKHATCTGGQLHEGLNLNYVTSRSSCQVGQSSIYMTM
jgi:hypothetical protein